jgi:phosphoglycerate dehydrogenase-like enzyme
MNRFLIISADADEIGAEISRLTDKPLEFLACSTPNEALEAYTNETIIFGRPDMVAEVLPDMTTVKWVQSTWAGVEPLLTLGRTDYYLTIIKNVFGPQMSEYVFAYLLAHELKLAERKLRQQAHEWFEARSGRLQGKKMGIMGTGSIGQHIACTAQTFGVKTIGLNRTGAMKSSFDQVLPVSQIDDFLPQLDYLVAVLPRTPGTDLLLDATALAQLPEHAYFINVGRSNVVDTDALVNALNNGTLAGAALDVFEEEPVPEGSPLWETANLSITAHIAAVSHPSLITPIFLENLQRYSADQDLKYRFDFEAGY